MPVHETAGMLRLGGRGSLLGEAGRWSGVAIPGPTPLPWTITMIIGRGGREGTLQEPTVSPGKTGAKERGPLRKVAVLAGGFVVSYALVLTIISDTFFWFAIPGMLGLATVVALVVHAVMSRSPGNDDMKVQAKRFAMIALVAVVMVAVPLVVDVRYLYPFVGVGIMTFVLGGRVWIEQKRRA
ncbi:hypothetical protein [Actinomadura sp.]|uniref:hypothetical protein n=2 Tax=Actinomadura sp. TaxID=1989 RepID=UPI0037C8FDEB